MNSQSIPEVYAQAMETARFLQRQLYRQNFKEFVSAAWPHVSSRRLVWGWHLDEICNALQDVADGVNNRLIINVPPRSLKSMLVSVLYPAWVWTRDSSHQFLTVSHSRTLSTRDARYSRNLIQSDWYRDLFPEVVIVSDQNQKMYYETERGGHRNAASVKEGLTGKGGDCLVGETMVETEWGPIRIDRLCQLVHKPRVLSLNHRSGALEYRRILAARELVAGTVAEVKTSGGRSLQCTVDHRLYVHGSYRQAGVLGQGERLTAISPRVSSLWRRDEQAVQGLQAVPVQDEAGGYRDQVREVRSRGGAAALRLQEAGVQAKRQGLLLLQRPQQGAPLHQKPQTLPTLREACSKENERVLLGVLSARVKAAAKTVGTAMLSLWESISASLIAHGVLLAEMRERRAFAAHDWSRKLEVEGRQELREVVQHDETCDSGAGWGGLRSLRTSHGPSRHQMGRSAGGEINLGHSPYRREPIKQQGGKPDHALQWVPYSASQIEEDAVDVVVVSRGESKPVYDIQVEGNCNFFANEILVHNCVLLDDMLSAEKVTISDNDINRCIEVYEESVEQRLNTPGKSAIIVIMQRLHANDITGWLLKNRKAEKWVHLCFPLLYEPDHPHLCARDQRKRAGEILLPDRWPKVAIDVVRQKPMVFAGQYQQRPSVRGGNILLRESWNVWTEANLPEIRYVIMSLDTAFKDGQQNDYSACTVWGLFEATSQTEVGNRRPKEKMDAILMHAWKARLRYPELRERIQVDYGKWVKRQMRPDIILIEDKASGQSLIQEFDAAGIPGVTPWPPRVKNSGVHANEPPMFRAQLASEILDDGAVWVPGRMMSDGRRDPKVLVPWAEEVVAEAEQFPRAEHDDLTTTVIQALRYMRQASLVDSSADVDDVVHGMIERHTQTEAFYG